MPKTRIDFWRPKLQENRRRDARNRSKLRRLGWDVFVVWECQIQRYSDEQLLEKLVAFLER